jgi:hypothetical protein
MTPGTPDGVPWPGRIPPFGNGFANMPGWRPPDAGPPGQTGQPGEQPENQMRTWANQFIQPTQLSPFLQQLLAQRAALSGADATNSGRQFGSPGAGTSGGLMTPPPPTDQPGGNQ